MKRLKMYVSDTNTDVKQCVCVCVGIQIRMRSSVCVCGNTTMYNTHENKYKNLTFNNITNFIFI